MTVSQKIKHYLWIFIEYFSLIFFSFVALLPVVSCVITAFKTETEYQNTNVMTLPESWLNFDNFIQAFNKANMGRAFINSFIVLVFVVFGSVMVGSMLAYVLNRFTFPGNGLIRSLFLFATLLPGIAMQVATYQLMYQIGFINHLYGYIILSMGTDVISIYIFIQFFENIPTSLDESAYMDGASYFTIFFKILFPLLKPAIVTVVKTEFDPRYPTIKSKMAAMRKEISVITSEDIPDIDLTRCGLKGSPTKVRKTFTPVKNKNCVIVDEGEVETSAVKLVEVLAEAKVL